MKKHDKKTAENVRGIASAAMDSAQLKIDKLNSLGSSARNQSSNYLLEWQKWIGTISFSLVAIGGALITKGEFSNITLLPSLLLFFVIGIWILIEHKRQFEITASTSSIDIDNYRPLYDDKKKAAFELWEDPESIEKHIVFLEKEEKIIEYTQSLNSIQNIELNHDKIVYLNDIWLGMFISSIYLLLYPTYDNIILRYDIKSFLSTLIYWIILIILLLFVTNDALKSKPYILQANKSKLLKAKSEKTHTDQYLERVKSEIGYLKKILRN